MGRYLLLANQTLGGQDLDAEIRRRIDDGPATFHVVVPLLAPEYEAAFIPADPTFTAPQPLTPDEGPSPMEEAHRRSEHRLERMLDRIRTLGGDADGVVGPEDAVAATEEALATFEPDEVIVSTLPAGISAWLKLDVPSRIDRKVSVPVTVVEATPTSGR